MPDEARDQAKVAQSTDARTSPSMVWSILENLKGDDLAAWRMADIANRATPLRSGRA